MSQHTLDEKQRNAAFKHNQGFSPQMRLFASGENLAKSAYDLTPMWQADAFPKEVAILDKDGQWKDYIPYALEVKTKGLHGFVLVPKDPSDKELKVTFRGTMDTASLYRDFEGHGPGAHSMLHEKDHLMAQIEQITQKHYGKNATKIALSIAGHSLGASDAENLAAHITHAKAHHGLFKGLSHLEVFSFNSPGIPHAIAKRSVEDARKILKENPEFNVQIHYGKSEHDAVQRLGESHVFNGLKPHEISMDLIEMDKDIDYAKDIEEYFHREKMPMTGIIVNLLVTLVYAHKLTTFFTPDKDGKIQFKHNGYKYLDNQNVKGAREIEDELNDKAHSLLKVYKYILSYFIDDIAHLLESKVLQEKRTQEAPLKASVKQNEPLTIAYKHSLKQKPLAAFKQNEENLEPHKPRFKVTP